MTEVRKLAPDRVRLAVGWPPSIRRLGFVANEETRGPAVGAGSHKGVHGLWPTHDGSRPVFILAGPGVKHARLTEISILDEAPTFAEILGVRLPRASGTSVWAGWEDRRAGVVRRPNRRQWKREIFSQRTMVQRSGRRAFINITSQVEACLLESGVKEGLVLVNAMHITASVFINDDESACTRITTNGSRSSRRMSPPRSTCTTGPARTMPTRI